MIDFIFKILELLFDFFRTKTKGVTLDIRIVDNAIHIKNTSSETAYNFEVNPSENLFWIFNHSTPETLTPNREMRIRFTRITANKKSGTLKCTWTNKKGNKKQEYTHPIDF